MLFGLLYGEALGGLGHHLGLPALWFYRGGPEALGPLAVGIGATHVLLSLVLGMRQARRLRHPRTLLERAGTFFLLCGLAAVAATAVHVLPGQVRTPTMAIVAVAFVVTISARGPMGLLTGPLELLGSFGHVLSYLRLAAVGLASVYLAEVANTLAVSVPLLLLGVFVAVLLHLLNLALAAFSPMVQALQAKIGSAAAGAIAEKPELTGRAILLVAIPETLVRTSVDAGDLDSDAVVSSCKALTQVERAFRAFTTWTSGRSGIALRSGPGARVFADAAVLRSAGTCRPGSPRCCSLTTTSQPPAPAPARLPARRHPTTPPRTPRRPG